MNIPFSPAVDQGAFQVASGIEREEQSAGANVTDIVQDGDRIFAGLGDGRLVLLNASGMQTLLNREGAITAVALLSGDRILSAGQDGQLLSVSADASGETDVLLNAEDAWIDAMAVSSDGNVVAGAIGKEVSVFSNDELIANFSDHPSTVSDLAFFNDNTRLAVSHYNGVSLWSLTDIEKPVRLSWAGSVVSVSISPDQRFIASATQDREIHVWDLENGRDYRLGGYLRKVKSIGWSTDSSICYTSGADVVVGWKLTADPSAIPPVEIGYAYAQTVSVVSKQADQSYIVAGFSDGSIQIGESRGGTAKVARPKSGAEITAIHAPVNSSVVAYGTACGIIGSIDVSTMNLL